MEERLRARGLEIEVRVLPDSTRTAKEAAAACGCELGQIVKSLVFVDDDGPMMCLWAGDRRVDTEALGLRPATPDEARDATGFAIGGVPPLGHDRELRTIVDGSLRRFDELWYAAGTPHAVFRVKTATLFDAVAGLADSRVDDVGTGTG